MIPQEHYEQAERLAGNAISSDLPMDELMFTVGLAQVHATLAQAGFTRDAATGADHVHDFNCGMRTVAEGEHGPVYSNRDTTDPGRPA